MNDGKGNTKLAMEVLKRTSAGEKVTKYSRISTVICRKEMGAIDKRLKAIEDIDDAAFPANEQRSNENFELAKTDCELVHGEIIDIKSCRTNIFMGTLGVLGAVGVGILGVIGLKGISTFPVQASPPAVAPVQTLPPVAAPGQASPPVAAPVQTSPPSASPVQVWLPVAAAIPIGLLTTAILATIHKARGINERAGYIRAVFECLVRRELPKGFCGWFTAKLVLEQCQHYLRIKNEKIENCRVATIVEHNEGQKREPFCVTKAREDSWKLNKGVDIFPPFLHSFTSFSTYIYSIAFVIAVLALLVVLLSTIKNELKDIKTGTYWIVIIVSFLLTSSLGTIAFFNKVRSYRKSVETGEREQSTRFGSVFKIYTYIAVGLFPAFLGGLLLSMFDKELEPLQIWQAICVYGFGFVIVVLVGAISLSCYDKVYSLRKGRYSIERWYCLWTTCLKHCPLMQVAQA